MHPKICILGCSDGTPPQSHAVSQLKQTLADVFHLSAQIDAALYETDTGRTQPPRIRAEALTAACLDPEIQAIFDVSGGDAANAVLPYLDFSLLRRHPKPFFGYSDLSVLLNPLHQLAGFPVWYFQPRFLSESLPARQSFSVAFQEVQPPQFPYTFLQGNSMEGTLAGGNIRCTLKLIGTPWQPDFAGRILFLESCSGGCKRMETMLRQYQQIGAFQQCRGILLGNFTEISRQGLLPALYEMVCEIVSDPSLPIVCTTAVGHQTDSICLPYHQVLRFRRENAQ